MTGVDKDTAMDSAAVMTSKIIFHALQRSGLREVFLIGLGASDTIPPRQHRHQSGKQPQ